MVEQIFALSGEGVKLANKKDETTAGGGNVFEIYPRLLYKFSEYAHPTYGKLWLCYTSVADPEPFETKLLSVLFALASVGGEVKIVAQFKIDRDAYNWRQVKGDSKIDTDALGIPVAVERLVSPYNDEWSVSEYLKDK